MGSAVSSVLSPVTSILGGVGGVVGSTTTSAISPLLNGIASIIPDVPVADQSVLQGQINQAAGNSNNAGNTGYALQNTANTQIGNTGVALNTANNALTTAQQTATGGNVANSLALLQAQANGTAPSAAQSVLQSGKNQAIAQQQAIANSGNASQMISGQKTALDNAASLTQQAANQATQLQATQQQTGQQNYATAAAQQAAQTGTNAANATALAGQQNALLGTEQTAANNYNNASITSNANAITGQTNALGIQQGALSQTGQNLATAVGGGLNALGGAATAISDEDTKTNINYASGKESGQEYVSSNMPSNLSLDGQLAQPQSPQQMQNQQPTAQKISSPSYTAFSGLGKNTVPGWQVLPLSSDANQKYNISYDSDPDPSSQPNAASQISKGFATGTGYTLSDKNSKKDIGPDKKDKVAKFLDAIDPVSYKYKKPDGLGGKTPGEHIGVIAQQVEKAPGGKSMIVETPQGKAIDLASAVGTLMAAAAETHDRIKTLEAVFKAKRKKK